MKYRDTTCSLYGSSVTVDKNVTHQRIHAPTDKPKAILPPTFSKLGAKLTKVIPFWPTGLTLLDPGRV